MSKVKTNELANVADTESVPIGDVINGSARAWVNFDGTGTVAIRDSYNVSSITDNGTGNYIVNFDTPMPDANYAVSASGDFTGVTATVGNSKTTSEVNIRYYTSNGSATDSPQMSAAIHGN
jgi:hypothetical protein